MSEKRFFFFSSLLLRYFEMKFLFFSANSRDRVRWASVREGESIHPLRKSKKCEGEENSLFSHVKKKSFFIYSTQRENKIKISEKKLSRSSPSFPRSCTLDGRKSTVWVRENVKKKTDTSTKKKHFSRSEGSRDDRVESLWDEFSAERKKKVKSQIMWKCSQCEGRTECKRACLTFYLLNGNFFLCYQFRRIVTHSTKSYQFDISGAPHTVKIDFSSKTVIRLKSQNCL